MSEIQACHSLMQHFGRDCGVSLVDYPRGQACVSPVCAGVRVDGKASTLRPGVFNRGRCVSDLSGTWHLHNGIRSSYVTSVRLDSSRRGVWRATNDCGCSLSVVRVADPTPVRVSSTNKPQVENRHVSTHSSIIGAPATDMDTSYRSLQDNRRLGPSWPTIGNHRTHPSS